MLFTEIIDIDKIKELFQYQESAPLVFNSGAFLLFFMVFWGIYLLLQSKQRVQILFTVLFSIFFYYKSSGTYFWILLVSTVINYYLGLALYKSKKPPLRKFYVASSVILSLGILAYFKYTNFGIRNWNLFTGSNFSELDLFLPVGISFYTFQTLSYSIDLYRKELEPAKNLIDFTFFVSFFPQLVAGPIVRAADFIPQIYQRLKLSKEDIGKALVLIFGGLFKKVVISDYISTNFVDRIFDNPLLYGSFENLMGVYGYAMQIYCDFSGYSDMAIGISLLLGYRLPDNFQSPYQSISLTEFWRKWHISLSSWLRDYLYIPLGGNRKGKIRTYINLLLTMLIGGLWHGASWKFVVWGGIHGAVLALEKLIFARFKNRDHVFMKIGGWFITFHIVCFAWIFFRADSFETANLVIQQIGSGIWLSDMLTLLSVYKTSLALIALAMLLHFVPIKWERNFMLMFGKLPMALQSIYVAVIVWITIQVAQSGVQPFIYFQF